MLRQHIVFTGWVQGVGFRYRAKYAASYYGVTGWVRNEMDGSVTMELQGTAVQINQVLQALGNGRFVRIESMDVQNIPYL